MAGVCVLGISEKIVSPGLRGTLRKHFVIHVNKPTMCSVQKERDDQVLGIGNEVSASPFQFCFK